MGIIGSIYKRIVLISPWLEVCIRKIYWKNVKLFKRFNPYNKDGNNNYKYNCYVDFDQIINYLKSKGLKGK